MVTLKFFFFPTTQNVKKKHPTHFGLFVKRGIKLNLCIQNISICRKDYLEVNVDGIGKSKYYDSE